MSKNNKSQNPKGIWARVRLGPAGHSRRLGTEVMGDTEYNRRTDKRDTLREIQETEETTADSCADFLDGIEEILDCQKAGDNGSYRSTHRTSSSNRAGYNTLAQKLQEYINK